MFRNYSPTLVNRRLMRPLPNMRDWGRIFFRWMLLWVNVSGDFSWILEGRPIFFCILTGSNFHLSYLFVVTCIWRSGLQGWCLLSAFCYSTVFLNYISGWICCTTWFAWFGYSLLFSRVVRIFFNVTRFSHDFISFLVAEQISILRLLENPFPSHSWILYWRWMLLWNGTHQMSLHLIGSCGMELTKCFLMWLNLVHRIFDQWERLVHCWKDASEFFYWFVWCYLLICLRQLLGECFWDCGAVIV